MADFVIPAFVVGLGYLFMAVVFVCLWWIILKKYPGVARLFIGDSGVKILPMALLIVVTAVMLLADGLFGIRIPALIVFMLISLMCAILSRRD